MLFAAGPMALPLLCLVRAWGFEPQRREAREPKSRMSANFIMPAFMKTRRKGIAAGAAVLRFFIVTQAKMLRKRKKGRVPCTTKRAVV